MKTNIVQVQFESRYKPGTYGGRAYTYRTDVPLDVGDIVKVPTKFGDNNAKVYRVDVPESEVPPGVELKHPTVSSGMFDGFF